MMHFPEITKAEYSQSSRIAKKLPITYLRLMMQFSSEEIQAMKNKEKSKSIILKIVIIFLACFALSLYLFYGYHGRVIFRPHTFCHQTEADANYISSAVLDYVDGTENNGYPPTQVDLELMVDVESPWTLTVCGDQFFINVIDRSGKCPVEYQNQHREWNANIYHIELQ